MVSKPSADPFLSESTCTWRKKSIFKIHKLTWKWQGLLSAHAFAHQEWRQLQHCLENTNAENKEPDLFFPSAIYNLHTSVESYHYFPKPWTGLWSLLMKLVMLWSLCFFLFCFKVQVDRHFGRCSILKLCTLFIDGIDSIECTKTLGLI